MRELSQAELDFVSGGKMPQWMRRFIDAVRSIWNRWPCAENGAEGTTRDGRSCVGLTDSEIESYCYSVGLSASAGGRYSTIKNKDARDICDVATDAVIELRNRSSGGGGSGGGDGPGAQNQEMM